MFIYTTITIIYLCPKDAIFFYNNISYWWKLYYYVWFWVSLLISLLFVVVIVHPIAFFPGNPHGPSLRSCWMTMPYAACRLMSTACLGSLEKRWIKRCSQWFHRVVYSGAQSSPLLTTINHCQSCYIMIYLYSVGPPKVMFVGL